jgi:hypothetical protein|tara:strand:- start:285 stop:734 length:450 start_codon:yes stop_codon:yes gene_type:complete
MRKDYRQNYRMGTNPFGRKSNLQKIAETFGPKKKVKKDKKPTKRMFANVGGGADTGKMGEVKSKLAVAMDKLKSMEPNNPRFSQRDIDRMLKMMESKKKKEMTPLAKGGSAKKKKKFPDMSGDGKVTMKDVLMARGVIPKKKKTKKKVI